MNGYFSALFTLFGNTTTLYGIVPQQLTALCVTNGTTQFI